MRRVLVCSVLLFAACKSDGASGPAAVANVAVSVASQISVGDSAKAIASLTDSRGKPVGGSVSWSSSANSVAHANPDGFIVGIAPGSATITATSGSANGTASVTISLPPIATLTLAPDSVTVAPSVSSQLTATARGANGQALTGRTFTYTSSNDVIATVSPSGLVTGVSAGAATVTVSAEGKSASAKVGVVQPGLVRITSVSPALLTPGATATIVGSGFGATVGSNSVTVAGTPATVTAASPTQLTVTLPTAGFTCNPTSSQQVVVSTGGDLGTFATPVQVATQLSLTAGQSMYLTGSALRCNELAATGGRYFIAVVNGSTAAGSLTAAEVRGAAANAPGSVLATPITTVRAETKAPSARGASLLTIQDVFNEQAQVRERQEHKRMMDFNRTSIRGLPSPHDAWVAERARASSAGSSSLTARVSSARAAAAAVGDTVNMRVIRLGNTPASCAALPFDVVRARTVYAGSKAIVLEDITAPLNGTMDSYYQAVGQEFDNTQYDMLVQNFGDPLAFDSQLQKTGKVVMLFTKKLNDVGGAPAYVLNCDFFPQSLVPGSNQESVFYAQVPTDPATGYGTSGRIAFTGTKDMWRHVVRGTIIHEVKHDASFAERFARNAQTFEETWMDEGQAVTAQEIFARSTNSFAARSNVNYRNSVYCDVRPSFPECGSLPFTMFSDFDGLNGYLESVESLSPLLIDRSLDPGETFYGSTWMFLRWGIDNYGASDAAFLKPMVQTATLAGVASFTARTGRPWGEMVADYTLALATNNLPGFTPQRTQLTIPSWNIRDVFAGMNKDFPNSFPKAAPAATRVMSYGTIPVTPMTIRAGSAAILDLGGMQSAKQMIEVRGSGGGNPAPTISVQIVRVQ
jgi:hypothetical protein